MKACLSQLFLIAVLNNVFGQLGLISISEEEVFEGVSLFHPNGSTDTYLIDNFGELVHIWPGTYSPGVAVYLLENGQLLRSGRLLDDYPFGGGVGGVLELVEWDGTVTWRFILSNEKEKLHHDYQYLPNGNILALAWEVKTNEEAIEMGRDPLTVEEGIWPEKILELKPTGDSEAEIVWAWYAWDHLIQNYEDTKPNFGEPEDHPNRIDINYDLDTNPDWLHANALSYNPELDQIMISIPDFDEVWIIDHSTSTEEASGSTGGNAGMGGDLLYRWGNPQSYGKGVEEDKRLYYQHNTTWLKQDGEWKILLFNNGRTRPEGFISSVDIIKMPWDGGFNYSLEESGIFGPDEAEWTYTADEPTSLYSAFVSGAQVLPNGNVLVCSGVQGDVFELNEDNERVWEYGIPVGADGTIFCLNDPEAQSGFTFKVIKYPMDYSGLGQLQDLGLLSGDDCEPPLSISENSLSELILKIENNEVIVSCNSKIRELLVADLSGKTIYHQSGNWSEVKINKEFITGTTLLVSAELANNQVVRKKIFMKTD